MSKIKIGYGKGEGEYGPGVLIRLDGNQVASAIDHWLHAKGFVVRGARTVRVFADDAGATVYVDPSGFVVHKGRKFSGRGPEEE